MHENNDKVITSSDCATVIWKPLVISWGTTVTQLQIWLWIGRHISQIFISLTHKSQVMSTGHYPLQAALNRSLPATRTTTLLSTITLRQHVVRHVMTFSPKSTAWNTTARSWYFVTDRWLWENMGKHGKIWENMGQHGPWENMVKRKLDINSKQ